MLWMMSGYALKLCRKVRFVADKELYKDRDSGQFTIWFSKMVYSND